jgi:cbb3-type cytochrome oxidase maturation protein
MESLYLLVPVALIFVVIAVKILFWAVNSGQYDDLDTEAHRILFDEDQPKTSKKTEEKTSEEPKE